MADKAALLVRKVPRARLLEILADAAEEPAAKRAKRGNSGAPSTAAPQPNRSLVAPSTAAQQPNRSLAEFFGEPVTNVERPALGEHYCEMVPTAKVEDKACADAAPTSEVSTAASGDSSPASTTLSEASSYAPQSPQEGTTPPANIKEATPDSGRRVPPHPPVTVWARKPSVGTSPQQRLLLPAGIPQQSAMKRAASADSSRPCLATRCQNCSRAMSARRILQAFDAGWSSWHTSAVSCPRPP